MWREQGRSEELARAASEQQEGNSPSASTSGITASGGGNGGLSSTTRANSSDVVAYMEDYDTSIPTVNTVCLLFFLHSDSAFCWMFCLHGQIV